MEIQPISKKDAEKWLKKGRYVYLYKTLYDNNLLWAVDRIIPHLKQYHMFTLKPKNNETDTAA